MRAKHFVRYAKYTMSDWLREVFFIADAIAGSPSVTIVLGVM